MAPANANTPGNFIPPVRPERSRLFRLVAHVVYAVIFIILSIGLFFQLRTLFPWEYPSWEYPSWEYPSELLDSAGKKWNQWRYPPILSNSTALDLYGTYDSETWTLPRIYEPINLILTKMPVLQLYATTISYQSHKLIALQPPIEVMGDDPDSVSTCLQFTEELTSVDSYLTGTISAIQSCTNMFTLDLRARTHWTHNASAEAQFYTKANARCENAVMEIKIVSLQIKELQSSYEEMRDMMANGMNYLVLPQQPGKRFASFRSDTVTEWKKALAMFAGGDPLREDEIQETLMNVHNLLQEITKILVAGRWGLIGNVYQQVWRESEDILKLLSFQNELRNRKAEVTSLKIYNTFTTAPATPKATSPSVAPKKSAAKGQK